MNVIASKVRQFAPYVLIFGLLGAVYLLPPDTSLGEVRKAGVLRACLPRELSAARHRRSRCAGDRRRDAAGAGKKSRREPDHLVQPRHRPGFQSAQLARDARAVRSPGRRRGGLAAHQILPRNDRALRPDRLGARGPDAARRSPGSARRRSDRCLGARSTGALELSPRQERGADHHA